MMKFQVNKQASQYVQFINVYSMIINVDTT